MLPDEEETALWNRVQYQPERVTEKENGRREALGCRMGGVYVYFYDGKFFYAEQKLRLPQIMHLSEYGFPLDDVEHVERCGVHVMVQDGNKVIVTKRELNW